VASPLLSGDDAMLLRTIVRWIKWGLIAAVTLEVGYLAAFNVWLPARVLELARRYELSLTLTGFRTLYPGDLRVRAVRLSGPNQSFVIATNELQGRLKLWGLLRGSLELAWLSVAGAQAHLKNPSALLLACSGPQIGVRRRNVFRAASLVVPSVDRILVDRAAIEVVSAELGALKLNGIVELRITHARLAETGLQMRAFAQFPNLSAARASGEEAPVTALSGDLAWELSPRSGAGAEAGGARTLLRGTMGWKTANLGRLLGTGPGLDALDAHLALELRLVDGAARLGSYVQLDAAELRLPPLHPAPSGALFRQARLRMELAAQSTPEEGLKGSFSLQSGDVEFGFHGQQQHFSLTGNAKIENLNASAPSLLLGAGKLHLQRGESRDPGAAAQQALSLVLTLDRAFWSSRSQLDLPSR
jgi:hypothetical protein